MTSDILLKIFFDHSNSIKHLVKLIKSNWFEARIDRIIWEEGIKCLNTYGEVPSVDVLKEKIRHNIDEGIFDDIDKRLIYINGLEIKQVDELIVVDLIKKYVEKEMIKNMLETTSQLYSENKFSQIWPIIDSTIGELSNIELKNIVSILDEQEVLRRYSRFIDENKDDKVGTLIKNLDKVLSTGLRKGTLTVVLGVTSVGKTMFLVYLASAITLQGKKVLYISLEDSKSVIDNRFDSLWFGTQDVYKRLKRREDLQNFGCEIFSVYENSLTVEGLKAIVKEYETNKIKLDCVIIDYGDLMHGEGRREEWREMGEIFEKLAKWAEKEQLWIITASQANRDALAHRVITMKNMGQAFKKAQVAHYVIALSQVPEEYEQDLVRIVVLKNKFGRANFTIACKVNRERQFFKEM